MKNRRIHIDFGFVPPLMRDKLGQRVLAAADKRNIGAGFSKMSADRLIIGTMTEDIPTILEIVDGVLRRATNRGELKEVA